MDSKLSGKLIKYGIENVSDYVLKGNWLPKEKIDGFDVFDEVTKWPKRVMDWSDIKVLDSVGCIHKYLHPSNFIGKSKNSTDLILKNETKIMWKNGQCLSFEPAKLVRL